MRQKQFNPHSYHGTEDAGSQDQSVLESAKDEVAGDGDRPAQVDIRPCLRAQLPRKSCHCCLRYLNSAVAFNMHVRNKLVDLNQQRL